MHFARALCLSRIVNLVFLSENRHCYARRMSTYSTCRMWILVILYFVRSSWFPSTCFVLCNLPLEHVSLLLLCRYTRLSDGDHLWRDLAEMNAVIILCFLPITYAYSELENGSHAMVTVVCSSHKIHYICDIEFFQLLIDVCWTNRSRKKKRV